MSGDKYNDVAQTSAQDASGAFQEEFATSLIITPLEQATREVTNHTVAVCDPLFSLAHDFQQSLANGRMEALNTQVRSVAENLPRLGADHAMGHLRRLAENIHNSHPSLNVNWSVGMNSAEKGKASITIEQTLANGGRITLTINSDGTNSATAALSDRHKTEKIPAAEALSWISELMMPKIKKID